MKLFYIILAIVAYSYSQDTDTTQVTETTTSKPECGGKNTRMVECSNLCGEKNCLNYDKPSPCFSLRCGPPACVCKEGHVFLSGEHSEGCVRREDCARLAQSKNESETDN